MHEKCGTFIFMAPEIIVNKEYSKVDTFVLYCKVSGHLEFRNYLIYAVYFRYSSILGF